ncbi:MAG: SPOR domain-containing protein [Candidatus Accumulibacter sp.]|uniref:SPOR domain-containing protein n=1 Tax=Accumulibacter sp. TaxID=2053492 RepID=UPI0019F053AF|nr:SPOR domain-containing protein [Accumulibacter sp.]MBE2257747.1 SPOR domain-containing protein [Paracoccaceae bacterium]MCB1941574.1 SPOR domain-containing protein [Accumulibacter sp.]MCP5248748.1 SPOR domain-containing protein [Accumulibacter sp.]
MSESSDPQLHLKKKARRRLVGAVAIAGLAAVVLPMVMDEEPKAPAQDVQIRIPGQDQLQFDPKELAARSAPPVAAVGEEHDGVAPKATATASTDEPADAAAARPVEKPVEKAAEKKTGKPVERAPSAKADKPAEKAPPAKADKPAAFPAADVGKPVEAPPAKSNGQHVILVGAFANPDNVKKLLSTIGKAGVPTYTEILNSPDGKRTRVRAGPFPNREAAEKALEKLKRIGVGGVVAAKP